MLKNLWFYVLQDSCIKCQWLEGRAGQVIHLLYEADVLDEDSLVEWYEELKEDESPLAKQASVVKFFEWLQEASEESESDWNNYIIVSKRM